jgi:putative membrane protein insertion efficiency factor
MKKPLQFLAIKTLRFYQLAISPLLGPRCRFHPSCSNYAIESISKYGFFVGVYLSLRRLLRCHPFNPGGYDPVPSDLSKERAPFNRHIRSKK